MIYYIIRRHFAGKGGGAVDGRLGDIERGEVLRYLSYRGAVQADARVSADLDRCEALLRACVRPRVVWRLFPLLPDGTLAGTTFRPAGGDVRTLLATCDGVILMAATLGAEAEALLRWAQARSMADAVLLDAIGSAAVENVCDNLCAELAETVAPRHLTDRFSPGYGDLPLAQQRELFAVLDVTRRIGVNLTESGLMVPQKSVTALIGVSDVRQPRRAQNCAACPQAAGCTFRREGKDCGKS